MNIVLFDWVDGIEGRWMDGFRDWTVGLRRLSDAEMGEARMSLENDLVDWEVASRSHRQSCFAVVGRRMALFRERDTLVDAMAIDESSRRSSNCVRRCCVGRIDEITNLTWTLSKVKS